MTRRLAVAVGRVQPRADRAGRSGSGGRTVALPGAARVERQSVRYAARAQPLDWLLIAMTT
jgi:hypothetical protein